MIQIGLHGGGRMRVSDEGVVDVSEVTPEALAFGLSHVTRFGGQAGPYSVCEHSCRIYDWAKHDRQDKAVLRAILIHDAPECLGEGDVQRFVKRAYRCDGLQMFAHDVSAALWDKFAPADRPTAWWTWETVHQTLKPYDEWIGMLEARAFGFSHEPIPDWLTPAFAPTKAVYDAPGWEGAFMRRWEECA